MEYLTCPTSGCEGEGARYEWNTGQEPIPVCGYCGNQLVVAND